MLRGIGWDIATVQQHNLESVDDDAILVAAARKMNRVLLSFDYMKGMQRVSVADELRNNGGRLIRVGGGPDKPAERSVGKLLFHYETWYPWLEVNEGRVEIADIKQRCSMIHRAEIRAGVRQVDTPPFDPYLEAKKERRKAPIKRRGSRKTVPSQQGALVLYGGTKAKSSK